MRSRLVLTSLALLASAPRPGARNDAGTDSLVRRSPPTCPASRPPPTPRPTAVRPEPDRHRRPTSGRRHARRPPRGAVGRGLPPRRRRGRHRAHVRARVLHVTPDGTLSRSAPFRSAVPQGEAGLLGVAVSPDFETDRDAVLLPHDRVRTTGSLQCRARRPHRWASRRSILDGIPPGFIHDGGRHRVRPRRLSLRHHRRDRRPRAGPGPRQASAGKILRITTDGDPAPGNPDPGSPVWSLGHRNVQGLAWDDEGRLWASEFGDSDVGRAQPGREGRQLRLAGGRGHRRRCGASSTRSSSGRSTRPRRAGWRTPTGTCGWPGCAAQRLWRIDGLQRRQGHRSPPAFFTEDYGRLRTVVTRTRRQPLAHHVQPGRPRRAHARRRPDHRHPP